MKTLLIAFLMTGSLVATSKTFAASITFGAPSKNSKLAQSLFQILKDNGSDAEIFGNGIRIEQITDDRPLQYIDIGSSIDEVGRCQKQVEPLFSDDGLVLPGGPESYTCFFNSTVYSEGRFVASERTLSLADLLQEALRIDNEKHGKTKLVRTSKDNVLTTQYILSETDGRLVCESKVKGNLITVEHYTCAFSKGL